MSKSFCLADKPRFRIGLFGCGTLYAWNRLGGRGLQFRKRWWRLKGYDSAIPRIKNAEFRFRSVFRHFDSIITSKVPPLYFYFMYAVNRTAILPESWTESKIFKNRFKPYEPNQWGAEPVRTESLIFNSSATFCTKTHKIGKNFTNGPIENLMFYWKQGIGLLENSALLLTNSPELSPIGNPYIRLVPLIGRMARRC
jgi:hypothetical protein